MKTVKNTSTLTLKLLEPYYAIYWEDTVGSEFEETARKYNEYDPDLYINIRSNTYNTSWIRIRDLHVVNKGSNGLPINVIINRIKSYDLQYKLLTKEDYNREMFLYML